MSISEARPPSNTEHDVLSFVDCVYDPSDIVEIRCLRNRVAKQSWCCAVNLLDNLDWLVGLNDDGWNIYIGANPRPAVKATGDECIQVARCFFVDFDGGVTPDEADQRRIAASLPRPTMTVFSGHGTHLYWRLAVPMTDLAYWTSMQKRLIAALGSDKSIHNPERIMRLPGYMNVKSEPHVRCYVVEADCNRVYELVDFLLPESQGKPEHKHEQNGNAAPNNRLDLLGRATLYVAKVPGVGQGERNAAAFRLAAKLLRQFGLSRSDAAPLMRSWNYTNSPPLDDAEIDSVCDAAEKYGNQPEGIEDRPWQPEYKGSDKPFQFEWLTSAELADCNDQVEYLIDHVVTRAQGGIVSGVFKTLKTAVAVDLFTSLATGTPFLGYFNVAAAMPCGFMSAEIGKAGLRERARQVADAKGYDPHELDKLHWSVGCPNIASLEHLDELQRFIEAKQLAMLGIDPSYLAFCEAGDKASNYIAMGRLLIGLTRLIDRTGCTVVLVNHNRHGRGALSKFAPAELSEISYAGFAEWARFWLLLGARQEWDEEVGRHWLWQRTGGSAGHAGLHHLNVTEGKRSDPGGRRWEVEVLAATEGNKRVEAERDAAREAKATEKLEKHIERLVRAMGKFPGGETKTAIKETSGLRHGEFIAAFAELLLRGDVAQCQVLKGNHKSPKDGYRLCDRS